MDQESLVKMLNDPVNNLIAQLSALGLEILATAWIKTSEFGPLSLYLVTPCAEDGRTEEVYKAIQSILRSANERWIRLTEIKLVGPSETLASDLIEIARRIGSNGGPLAYGGELGGTPVFGTAFIYPAVKPTPAPATGS